MINNIKEILNKLIAFPSITPHSNGAIEYIGQLLQTQGFEVEIKNFGTKDCLVSNLYAKYGTSKPNICFAGHIDVVPPGDLSLWHHDPFVAYYTGDKIFGRGTVDMKGSIACMLEAAIRYIADNPNPQGSISFLITSDEEGIAQYGTKEMLKYLAYKNEFIDFAILGEPTCEVQVGDTIKIGRRGSINFTLTINGKQGHVAYPQDAINPTTILINILHELNNYSFDLGSEFFQHSHFETTSIDVNNEVTNLIPCQACAKFNIRFNDLHSDVQLVQIIKSIITKYSDNYNLVHQVSANHFIQNPVAYIEKFAEIVGASCQTHPKFSTSGGTSDARFIKDYCPVVEFGLLHKTAHQINEYTEINDLQRAYDVYYNCLSKFLN